VSSGYGISTGQVVFLFVVVALFGSCVTCGAQWVTEHYRVKIEKVEPKESKP
jgi:hypothetical protein